MIKLLLLLPAINIKRISDEQGIALITSYLRKNGHSVDMQVIENVHDIDGIAVGNYDIIGITAYHENLLNVYKMSERIKQIDKDIRICIGGYSATYYYEEILNDCPWIDFIIKGEGEEVFLELCNRLDNKENIFDVHGIIYRGDEGIVVNPDRECIKDLDSLPFAAKDIFNRHHLGLVLLSTSRGCLNNCSFCYSHSYFDVSGGVKWRGRSVNNVIDEILYIKNNYEIDKFFFNNASFEDSLLPLEFLKNFAQEITDREINISYCANFRATFYRFCDENLEKLLIESGLTGSFVGIEAFNE